MFCASYAMLNNIANIVTWENDSIHPGVGLQELSHGQGILEVLPHPQMKGLQATVTQVTVEGGRYCSQGFKRAKKDQRGTTCSC